MFNPKYLLLTFDNLLTILDKELKESNESRSGWEMTEAIEIANELRRRWNHYQDIAESDQ